MHVNYRTKNMKLSQNDQWSVNSCMYEFWLIINYTNKNIHIASIGCVQKCNYDNIIYYISCGCPLNGQEGHFIVVKQFANMKT